MSGARAGHGNAPRAAAFAALVVLCAVFGTVYVLHARTENPRAGHPTESTIVPTRSALASLMRQPHILFRNTDLGPNFGRVEVVPITNPTGPRTLTPLTCDRVAMAGGVGLCGTTKLGAFTTYTGEIFGPSFAVERTVPLVGVANRVRISPNGRWATVTEFVHGDSYAASNFSTRADVIDTHSGTNIGNLEAFTVTDRGAVVGFINRNYWGITFAADSNHFYATQDVGAHIQLIEGTVSGRVAHTLMSDVECPSISPDQTRIAYKQRTGSGLTGVRWRLHVLDLRTGVNHALAETRNVDDQVEWLDNHTVAYAIPRPGSRVVTDVWSVPADGSGRPALLIPGASSPSVSNPR